MKYYKIIVAYLVEADDPATAQQKAVINHATLTTIVSVDEVTDAVEQVIHTYHHPQPDKGL